MPINYFPAVAVSLPIANHHSARSGCSWQAFHTLTFTNHFSQPSGLQGQSMQNPGVLWFMIKQCQFSDQIQGHNRGAASLHPEASCGGDLRQVPGSRTFPDSAVDLAGHHHKGSFGPALPDVLKRTCRHLPAKNQPWKESKHLIQRLLCSMRHSNERLRSDLNAMGNDSHGGGSDYEVAAGKLVGHPTAQAGQHPASFAAVPRSSSVQKVRSFWGRYERLVAAVHP
jgi:hypothetical protein